MRMPETPGDIEKLPQELLFDIFAYLSLGDLATCCSVSRKWSTVAADHRLWKSVEIHLSEIETRRFCTNGLLTRLAQAESLKITSSRRNIEPSLDAWIQAIRNNNGLGPSRLKQLEISGIPLSGHCVKVGVLIGYLSRTIEDLSLRHTLIGSDALFMFEDMPTLRILDLSYTNIEDAGLEALLVSKYSSNLEQLRLDAVMRVTQQGMTRFLTSWKADNLKLISLNHNESLMPQALRLFVSRNRGLAVSIRGSDHFTVKDVSDVKEAGECRDISHSAVLQDWSLESLRRYVDYLTTGVEWFSVKD